MEEKMQLVYGVAYKYLIEITDGILSKDELERYFKPNVKPDNMEDILYRILASAQNTGRLQNLIAFESKERKDIFKTILCNFIIDEILGKYNDKTLFKEFKKQFEIKNAESPKNSWRRYSTTIISACNFLKNFKDAKQFYNYADSFENEKEKLPLEMSKIITGMGFALCCDAIKELGYENYVKPDIHIKRIFKDLNLCEVSEKMNKIEDEINVFKTGLKMAEIVGETPYKVDKIFWLISTRSYYLDVDKFEIKGFRDEFVEKVKKLI